MTSCPALHGHLWFRTIRLNFAEHNSRANKVIHQNFQLEPCNHIHSTGCIFSQIGQKVHPIKWNYQNTWFTGLTLKLQSPFYHVKTQQISSCVKTSGLCYRTAWFPNTEKNISVMNKLLNSCQISRVDLIKTCFKVIWFISLCSFKIYFLHIQRNCMLSSNLTTLSDCIK